MNIDELLRDTFHSHEHLTPDPARVLGDIQQQIRGRRRHRRTRLLSTSGAVIAVAAIAATVSVFAGSTHHNSPSSPATSSVTAAATTSTDPAPTSPVTSASSIHSMRIPLSEYKIAITHTGDYTYTSPPLKLPHPITSDPNDIELSWGFVGGQATIAMTKGGGIRIVPANGDWSGPLVIQAQFRVDSFTGHPTLQFDSAGIGISGG
jgi:hypothetical protein